MDGGCTPLEGAMVDVCGTATRTAFTARSRPPASRPWAEVPARLPSAEFPLLPTLMSKSATKRGAYAPVTSVKSKRLIRIHEAIDDEGRLRRQSIVPSVLSCFPNGNHRGEACD